MANNRTKPSDTISRESLPAAAGRWLTRALPPNLDLTLSIRIQQAGEMEIRGNWTPFEATGVYRATPLSFNWQAKLRLTGPFWVLAEDGHLEGQGWGDARLWGIIPMGKRSDPQVLKAQLVRNLGELPWLPSFVLSGPGLTWSEVGENAFQVRASAGDQEGTIRFEIDDAGDVLSAYSPARPYDVPGGYEEAPWHYQFSDHHEFGGVRIPCAAVATFEKEDGPWEYLRVRVKDVTYDATRS